MGPVLSTCIHLVFVIDRIEPPYAVVEWTEAAEMSDVAQHHFPHEATEGSTWTIHLVPDPKGTAKSAPGDQEVELALPPISTEKMSLTYQFRLSPGQSVH